MRQIGIQPRAFAALLASCARTVLAKDAQPVLASDIEPALKGWPKSRGRVVKALGSKLRGRLANDQASPDEVAMQLLDMIDGGRGGGGQASRGAGYQTARDELSAELKEMLRGKLDAREFAAVMRAIDEADYADDEQRPREARDDDETEDNGYVDQRDRRNGDHLLVSKIRAITAGKLTDEDAAEVERCLVNLLEDGDGEIEAEDEPPAFPGEPLAGGKMRPLETKPTINPPMGHAAEDARRARLYKAEIQAQNASSFDQRFKDAARIKGGQPPVQYRDGTPVKDARLLDRGSPRSRVSARSAAMDSRSSNDFAQRFPVATRIKVI